MGWGTDFTAEVFLNKLIFNNEIEVQNKIDENIKDIGEAKAKIKMFASSTPNDIIPDDYKDDSIDWINTSLNDLFDIITELTEENVRLYQYIEYINDNGNDKIYISWYIFSKIHANETAKAYKFGMFKEDLGEKIPYLTNKKEAIDLIKKYSEEQ